ncbi:MAG: hypothetical protein QE263_02040 [Vampirovibrionales bacterium]|nr:hypothetical protein [Vampirovibrionales bacterium]
MPLEKDPANKEVVRQLLDDSLASTIVKITIWPIALITSIAYMFEYPWGLNLSKESIDFWQSWSTPIMYIASIFALYSVFRAIYLKKRDGKKFKMPMDIAILSLLDLVALCAFTYDFVQKNS